MSNQVGAIDIAVRAVVGREFESDLDKAKDKAGKAGKEIAGAVDKETSGMERLLGERFGGIGSKLTSTLTPVAAGLAVAFAGIGASWKSASKDMALTTGLTGDSLKGMMSSVKDVAGTVVGSVSQVSDTMAELYQKTKLTGDPLEDLTKKLLLLKEVGQEVVAADVGAAFGKWQIPTEQWASALDRLYKVAVETGISVPTLLSRLAEFEPVLKGLGYNFDQAAILAARLPTTVLPALKASLADAAGAQANLVENQLKAEAAQVKYTAAVTKHGETSLQARTAANGLAEAQALVALGSQNIAATFAAQIETVKTATTTDEAMRLGMEAFGTRAGPAMVEAIRAGKFEVEGLTAKVAESHVDLQQAAEEHRSLGDKIGMLKEKLVAVAGPFSGHAATIATIATGVGPVVSAMKSIGTSLGIIGPASTVAAVGQAALATATVAEGTAAAVATPPTLSLAAGIWAVTWPVLAVIAAILLLILAVVLIVKNWDWLKEKAGQIWDWIWDKVSTVVGWLIDNWGLLLGPIGLIIQHFGTLKEKAGEVWDWIWNKISGVVDFIIGIPGSIKNALVGVFDGVVEGFKTAWNAVARLVNSADFTMPASVPIIGGKTIGLPDLPILDSGGILTSPGLWAKADYRPEIVAPLDDLGAMYDSGGSRGGSGGGGDTYIVVQGSVIAERKLLELVKGGAAKTARYNVSSGLG